jgi:hypothetical protein
MFLLDFFYNNNFCYAVAESAGSHYQSRYFLILTFVLSDLYVFADTTSLSGFLYDSNTSFLFLQRHIGTFFVVRHVVRV